MSSKPDLYSVESMEHFVGQVVKRLRAAGDQYGHVENLNLAGQLMDLFEKYRVTQDPVRDYCLRMVLMKVARIACSDSDQDQSDSWRDLIGYALLGASGDEDVIQEIATIFPHLNEDNFDE